MGSLIDSEYKHLQCMHQEAEVPFVFQMDNGCIFRIDNVVVVHHRTLIKQLHEQRRVELKFCVRNDEELNGTETVEQWEIVFFPMYKGDREVAYAAIVRHFDSVVNGNLAIEGSSVVDCSTNHCDPDYEELQDLVTNYARDYVQSILDYRL